MHRCPPILLDTELFERKLDTYSPVAKADESDVRGNTAGEGHCINDL